MILADTYGSKESAEEGTRLGIQLAAALMDRPDARSRETPSLEAHWPSSALGILLGAVAIFVLVHWI